MIEIYKFYFDKGEEITPEIAGKIIRKFKTSALTQLSFSRGYYEGTGQAIMRRVQEDTSRPCNRIVKNYCATIVDNFNGYLTGNPISYSAQDINQNIERLQEVLESNDVANTDAEFLRMALIYGVAYELCYVNEDTELKFKTVSPETTIPVYSDDLDEKLLYVITFSVIANWQDEFQPTKYRVCIYDNENIYTYIAANDFNSFSLLEQEPHYFHQVPFTIFNLNADNKSIFERIISLQDAYNSLLSDEVNDFQAFVDAYMVMKNLNADEEELAEMKRTRTILIDGDSDVSYLTKNISDTQIENMLNNINSSIHTVSNSPDFSSEEFNSGVSSGTALAFKLVGFNNIASNIQNQMLKALQHRITLLNTVLQLVDTDTCQVDIDFTHNLPTNIADIVNMINALRGLVSDSTLLAQVPFIDNVDAELAKIEAENSKMAIDYSIPRGVIENGEEE